MQDKSILKILVILSALLMVVSCVVPSIAVDNKLTNDGSTYGKLILSAPSKNVIYVPDNYAKIQWAVDNASDADTIIFS